MFLRLLAPLAAVAIVVSFAGALALRGGDDSPGGATASLTGHPDALPASVRTVVISRTMPSPSAHERRLSARLEQGAMPGRPVIATVMTDSDCTPDAEMISRCRNVVQLANGRELTLRHPHDMRAIPCLAPGERVRLVLADQQRRS